MSLNPKREIFQVIGCLLQKPSLLSDKKFDLERDDFPELFHLIVYSTISNLYYEGNHDIDAISIDNYLSKFPEQYQTFNNNEGINYINSALECSNLGNFEYNYEKLKKATILREFAKNGFDITELYDEKSIDIKDIEKKQQKLDEMTVNDIIAHFNSKFLSIKKKTKASSETGYSFQAGEGVRELKEKYKNSPAIGKPYNSQILTSITRGMRRKTVMLRSGSTGSGKSRNAIADVCSVSVGEIYNLNTKRWEVIGTKEGGLYISTELEKEEVQTCMLAYISGVEEDKILYATYEGDEEERVDRAIHILEKANLYVDFIPNFDIEDIEEIIENKVIETGAGYVFFDYVHITPKLLSSLSKSSGMKLREDQVLFLFSYSLKIMANNFDIFLSAGTQLNRNYKDNEEQDATTLRGGMSTGDKVDVGLISSPPSKKELEKVKPILEKGFFKEPNMVHTIWKNRGNKHKNVKIFTHVNLGNVREEDLFMTDGDYKLIPVESLKILLQD